MTLESNMRIGNSFFIQVKLVIDLYWVITSISCSFKVDVHIYRTGLNILLVNNLEPHWNRSKLGTNITRLWVLICNVNDDKYYFIKYSTLPLVVKTTLLYWQSTIKEKCFDLDLNCSAMRKINAKQLTP